MADKKQRRSTEPTPKKGSPPRHWRARFLAELAVTGNVSHSSEAAHVSRDTAYEHRKSDPQFADAWADAIEEANDALEAEARRRAVTGVDEPVIYQGQVAGEWIGPDGRPATEGTDGAKFVPLTVKKYSDSLLIFLLNGDRPEKFRQNLKVSGDVEHKHSGEVAVREATPAHVLEVLADLARRRAGVAGAADPGRPAEGNRPS